VKEAGALGLPDYRVIPDHLHRVFAEAVFASQAGARLARAPLHGRRAAAPPVAPSRLTSLK